MILFILQLLSSATGKFDLLGQFPYLGKHALLLNHILKRFLQRWKKLKLHEPTYSQAFSQIKIDWQVVSESVPGQVSSVRKADNLTTMVDGI